MYDEGWVERLGETWVVLPKVMAMEYINWLQWQVMSVYHEKRSSDRGSSGANRGAKDLAFEDATVFFPLLHTSLFLSLNISFANATACT